MGDWLSSTPLSLLTMANHFSFTVAGGSRYLENARDVTIQDSTFGNFSNAHDFTIQNLTLGNMAQNPVFEWLGKRIMAGAEFDSSERDPPPRCHPGTRLSIVQLIRDWLQGLSRLQNFLWLEGAAGVGKSAIIQTLAESVSKLDRVVATLFFSTLNGRNDPNRALATLAYQLAVQNPSYRAYVVELMSRDPRSLDKAMGEQFMKLFIEPFTQRGIGRGSTPWIIMLDGLDECRPPDARSQAETLRWQHAQCEIIRLISTFASEHPSVPLLWIVSSRPESHLRAFFSRPDIHTTHWEVEVPIDSDEACQDVERYLRSEFENIRQHYPYHIPTASPWPCEEHISIIARSARGHFAFAATVTKFIEDPNIGDPIAQLKHILIFIDPRNERRVEGNPLAALDMLYTSILQQIHPAILPLMKRILGYFLLVDVCKEPAYVSPFTVACNILDIEQNRAYSALQKLYAVLNIPHPTDAGEQRLTFRHKSFVDYLTDEDRPHHFSIGRVDVLVGPWFGCICTLGQAVVPHEPTPDISNISLCWSPLEKSAQVQLQWRVYAAASTLFGLLLTNIDEELVLGMLQSTDFSTIIGGHLIFGMHSNVYSNFCLFFVDLCVTPCFPSRGLARPINLGNVDVGHIRNDRSAYYSIKSFFLSGDQMLSGRKDSYFYHPEAAGALQAYRFDLDYVAKLPNVDLQNPFSQLTAPRVPLSTLLDRFRLLQEQYPWARAIILGGSPSTSCIVFKCNRVSDGRLVDDHGVRSVLESQPEGTEMTCETFILPYFDVVGENCLNY
ncbi:hypothetical protein P691DRAFT_779486 [Macrolepiota fuliginosa MF-IS2]|uniref:NACHT domain-containing protein n=1 Tax=Macrolepiota fuliginosa MF-IS2 TaxID=1400762 RepID=A0A9P5X090_9AGAR|nr:hypothetical protein P691DRAFT_779486 [Macrolepiota fuliginosa MF-IS2]